MSRRRSNREAIELVDRLINATDVHAFAGSYPAEERDDIAAEFNARRRDVVEQLCGDVCITDREEQGAMTLCGLPSALVRTDSPTCVMKASCPECLRVLEDHRRAVR